MDYSVVLIYLLVYGGPIILWYWCSLIVNHASKSKPADSAAKGQNVFHHVRYLSGHVIRTSSRPHLRSPPVCICPIIPLRY
ncbi:hypothetical protein OBBRIDRAFT_76534 [Obba rivulosa]|uniref:Uncharacterized protein n=1 Tax=Obba rivulosa TaxID=1052685 RepID=A0A8E2DSB9_9APHY|nr:hypothetical protein OBBRIDRAFT_76534 [Obba rivulosa]